jgi:hypothetical protein
MEQKLNTLRRGDWFVIHLDTTGRSVEGVVRDKSSGSVTVETEAGVQHWCLDTLVEQIESKGEMNMKKQRVKKVAAEKKPRGPLTYEFDVEAARKVRDSKEFADRDNATTKTLRELITRNKKRYEFTEIQAVAKAAGITNQWTGMSPMRVMTKSGVLSRVVAAEGGSEAPKPRRSPKKAPKEPAEAA